MTRTALSHIVFVDDEPDILELATISLSAIGKLSVTPRPTAKGLNDVLLREQPDLVVLDVMMPDIDGPSALLRMRHDARLAAIPAVFMTARIQPEEVREYKALGAAGVLPKPFDPMHLHERLREIWATC